MTDTQLGLPLGRGPGVFVAGGFEPASLDFQALTGDAWVSKAQKTLIGRGYRSLMVNPELRLNAHLNAQHRNLSAAADCGDNRNLTSGRDGARRPRSECAQDHPERGSGGVVGKPKTIPVGTARPLVLPLV